MVHDKRGALGVGIDIVHIPRVAALLSNATALKRIFTDAELKNRSPAHLAGILAAKEAVFKALDVPPVWHEVVVNSEKTGKPKILLSKKSMAPDFIDVSVIDVSISHDGDYATAVVLLERSE